METLFKKRQERLNIFKKLRNQEKISPKKEIPDHLFTSCPHCHANLVTAQLAKNLYVCPQCGHHFRLSARQRINQIIDEGTFKESDKYVQTENAHEFVGYQEKLKLSYQKSGLLEGVVTGYGKINKQNVCIAVMDANFMMGSMGHVVGDKITRLIETAEKKHFPLIIFCTSGGARMQEGIISLMQMAKTSQALKRFKEAQNLYISVLCDPTTGGVSASFAMLGDIMIAEPKALVGFAGKRVIEKTINEKLPEDFQTAEFLMEHGFLDMIVKRDEMKSVLAKLIKIHGGAHGSTAKITNDQRA